MVENRLDHELEVKFYLTNRRAVETRLKALDANLLYIRTYELNLRFDLPDGSLTREHKVLRLRQDSAARLTFKGPSQARDDVNARAEIEFQVSDFGAAQRMLEALGYEVAFSYEKYRATYDLNGVEVTIDELPFGTFTEIEGPDASSIQKTAQDLGLDWAERITASYTALFQRMKENRKMTIRDLTFANLDGCHVTAADLGVNPADVGQG